MLGYNENKVNWEILQYPESHNSDGTKVYELIIRGEEEKKTEGIIIKHKNMQEIKEIIRDIEELNLEEVIKYINNHKIIAEKISFM